jgi:Polyketide cyclase / dehydrase and lipid transport
MNWKVIVGAIVLLIVVVVGYYYVQYRRMAAELAGATEVVEASFKKDGAVAKLHYVGIVDGPIDKVQDAVWGVERSSQMIENFKKSELVQQNGNEKTVLLQLKAGSLPLQQVVMVFTLDAAKHEIAFKTTQAQLADLEGTYRLAPEGNRTLLTYEGTATDKVANPLPDGVIETAQREVFVNTIRGIDKAIGAAPRPTAG